MIPDTLGMADGRAAFVDTWMTDTGVHLWPLATEMPTPSCFEDDCATALVRFLHGWIRSGQPLRYDGRETQDYGVLTRAREITGSLAYSYSISGFRVVCCRSRPLMAWRSRPMMAIASVLGRGSREQVGDGRRERGQQPVSSITFVRVSR